MDKDIKYSVWISLAFQGCPRNIWNRLRAAGGAAEFYFSFAGGERSGLEQREVEALRAVTVAQAEEVAAYCNKKGYRLLSFYEDIYPALLREIDKPPLLLYCMGDTSALDCDCGVAVVGTRHPTAYGVSFTKAVCDELAAYGFTIISGFALGIDSVAHYTALKSGAPTIAVLGCGLEYSYPRENDKFKALIARNGVVVTEYMPSARPDNWKFPQRNRIISGLARGVVVVEAGARSGALVTAKIAADQGRDVFCMPPPNVFDSGFAGNISLLREGAVPVFDASDIAAHYMDISDFEDLRDTLKERRKDAPVPDKTMRQERVKPDFSMLDDRQQMLVKLLETGSKHTDELAAELGWPLADLFLMLTELEIAGIIEAQAGKNYILAQGK